MCDLTTEWYDADLQLPDNQEQVLVVYEFEIADVDDSAIYQCYGVSRYSSFFHEWETKFLETGNRGYLKVLRWHRLPILSPSGHRRIDKWGLLS